MWHLQTTRRKVSAATPILCLSSKSQRDFACIEVWSTTMPDKFDPYREALVIETLTGVA